jgi:hypothetical protein
MFQIFAKRGPLAAPHTLSVVQRPRDSDCCEWSYDREPILRRCLCSSLCATAHSARHVPTRASPACCSVSFSEEITQLHHCYLRKNLEHTVDVSGHFATPRERRRKSQHWTPVVLLEESRQCCKKGSGAPHQVLTFTRQCTDSRVRTIGLIHSNRVIVAGSRVASFYAQNHILRPSPSTPATQMTRVLLPPRQTSAAIPP